MSLLAPCRWPHGGGMGASAAIPSANELLGAPADPSIAAAISQNWPWWIFPSKTSQRRTPKAWIAAPANGVPTEILEFQVPAGFQYVLEAIWHNFTTNLNPNPFQEGSGSILWSVTVDAPPGSTGSSGAAVAGYTLQDLDNMAELRGTAQEPWHLSGYNVFAAFQTLRYVVTTTAAISPGVPNQIFACFVGHLEPL